MQSLDLSLPAVAETQDQPQLSQAHNPTLLLGSLGTEGNLPSLVTIRTGDIDTRAYETTPKTPNLR